VSIQETAALYRSRPMANVEVLLVPIACPDQGQLAALARNLARAGIAVATAPDQSIDPARYSAPRNQYRADGLLAQARRAAADRVLAITEVDLYMPGLNFVFGVAGGQAAVVSLQRLRAGADTGLLEERLLKEALLKIGHTFGLGHCPQPRCVMSFSNSLAEADRKTAQFCNACQGELNARRQR
jgi:archaemetzincin